MTDHVIYLVFSLYSATIFVALAIYGWVHRTETSAESFAVAMLGGALWELCCVLPSCGRSLEYRVFWLNAGQIFLTLVVFFWVVMILCRTGRFAPLKVPYLWALCIIPGITIILIMTSRYHHLFLCDFHLEGNGLLLRYSRGVWWYVIEAYGSGSLVISLVIFARSFARPFSASDSRELALVVTSISVPLLADLAFQFGISPVPGVNLAPCTTALSGLLLGFVIFRYDAFELVPLAQGLLLETFPDAVLMLGSQGQLVHSNRAAQRIFGLDPKRSTGQPPKAVLVGWDHFLDCISQGGAVSKVIVTEAAGRKYFYDVSVLPVINRKGVTVGRVANLRDITERKQAEEASQESNDRFRSVLENSRDCIYRLNLKTGFYDYISPAAENLFGFSLGELLAQNVGARLAMIHPSDMPSLQAALARLEETGEGDAEYRQQLKSGDYRWFSARMFLTRDCAGQPLYRAGNVRDISDRKRAEKALKQAHDELEQKVSERTAELRAANAAISKSEVSLRALSDNIPNGITYQLVRTPDGHSWFDYISAGVERYGLPVERALADFHCVYAAIHPDDLHRVLKAGEESARMLSICNVEGRIITASGEVRWLHWRSTPHRLENGNTISFGIATDITDRKMVAETLRASEERYRVVMDNIGIGIALISPRMEILNVNRRMRAMYPGIDISERPPCYRTFNNPAFSEVCSYCPTVKTLADGCVHESITETPLGDEIRNHRIISSPIKNEHGEVVAAIEMVEDITERKRLENELFEISEREKRIIAQELHDGICQHLAGTAMLSKMLQQQLAGKGNQHAEFAQEICDLLSTAVEEARNLSHGLHPVNEDPKGLMDALKVMAGNVTKLFHIRCSFRCITPVFIENEITATHLFRIAQESVNNAIKHGQSNRVLINLSYSEEGITLSIRDNGIGIPSDVPTTGMGMQIMNHRASTIGATVTIRRSGKRGTLVSCTLPFST